MKGDAATDTLRTEREQTKQTEPLRAVRLWTFSHRYFIILTTKGELYKVTTHKPYRLSPIKQPLDYGWTPTELVTLLAEKNTPQRKQDLQLLQRQRKQYLEIFRKALPLSQPDSTTTDNTGYINAFTDMAKKLNIRPKEALERIREEIQHDRALEEYMKTEEFRQFEENADAYLKEVENMDLLRTALSEIANGLGVTLEEALERIAKGVEQTKHAI